MKKYFSLAIITLLLFSCQKDDEGSSGGGVFVPPATTTCKVETEELIVDGDVQNKEVNRYYYSDNLLVKKVSGNGTILYDSTEYLYNSQKQLIFVLRTDFFSGLKDTTYTLEYNASDQLSTLLAVTVKVTL